MKLIVGDITSKVDNPRQYLPALAAIREVLRARPDGYQYSPKYKSGLWDGYISLMSSFSSFPTGLLSLVVKVLEDKDYEVQCVANNTRPKYVPVTEGILENISLRDYQIEAANVLLAAGRGVAKMATNSGKTEVMASIAKALDCFTIVLLHRKELLHQTAERFRRRGVKDVGMIGDGIWEPNKVTVAMVQTLSNQIADWKGVAYNTCLMVDECHHISSTQMLDVISQIPGCYRFGFSGTPLKYEVLSDMKLMAATGPVLVDITNQYMVEHGFSAKPIVEIVVVENDSLFKRWWKADFQTAYEELIVNNVIRNNTIATFAKQHASAGEAVLVLVNRIDHGNKLAGLIPNSLFVNGSHDMTYRNQVLEKMRREPGVYIASPIFDEGIDVPALDAVVIAAGGKSQIKLLQRIGRGLRHKEGSNTMVVLDFIDDTNKYLLEHSDDRINTYTQEKFATKLVGR